MPKMPKKPNKPEKAKKLKIEKPKIKNVKNAMSATIAENAKTAKIAETEIVRFPESFEVWIFFGKAHGLFVKSLFFISKFCMVQVCCRLRNNWFYFSKRFSTQIMGFFGKKSVFFERVKT